MDRIRFDYTHLSADVVGPDHGLTQAELAGCVAPSRAAALAW